MRVHELQDLLLIVRISDGGVFLDVSMGTGRRCMKEGNRFHPLLPFRTILVLTYDDLWQVVLRLAYLGLI